MIELADLVAAVPAAVSQQGHTLFTRAVINSGGVREGDLFFALPGETRDGHDYAHDAVRAGARGVVVTREIPGMTPGTTVVRVADTVAALQQVAAATRRRLAPVVIAVTGSAGKTTTKDMIAHVLAARFEVLRSQASFNNHLGVPLTLLEMSSEHSHVVAEIGTNHPGEIDALARLAAPDVGVITNVGSAHIGYFGSEDAIAAEKVDLLRHVRTGGLWVLNGDDARLVAAAEQIPSRAQARLVRVGFGVDNDIRARDVRVEETGTTGMIVAGGAEIRFSLPVSGRHFVYDALLAVAVGTAHGIGIEAGVRALRSFVGPRGRVTLVRVSPNLLIIDDSYNSSPDAALAALDVLGAMPASEKIVVLGEMRELGTASARLHDRVGTEVAAVATALVTVGDGDGCRHLRRAAQRAGLAAGRIWAAGSTGEALTRARTVTGAADTGCAVLIKGSRFTHMERVQLGFAGRSVACSLEVCRLYLHCSGCPKLAAS